jgi:hypothetical protein
MKTVFTASRRGRGNQNAARDGQLGRDNDGDAEIEHVYEVNEAGGELEHRGDTCPKLEERERSRRCHVRWARARHPLARSLWFDRTKDEYADMILAIVCRGGNQMTIAGALKN